MTGRTAIDYAYDSQGRLKTVTQGARTTSLNYLSTGFLDTVTDSLSRTTAFSYDAVGRVVGQQLPDSRVIGFTYDANGNISSITPPSKPVHAFTFNLIDLIGSYLAPNLGGGSTPTSSSYNLDKQLSDILRADAKSIHWVYEGDLVGQTKTGRLIQIQTPSGNTNYTYSNTSPYLKSVRSADLVTTTFDYDGSLLTQATNTGSMTGAVAYSYNSDFLVSATVVNGTSVVSYTYDRDNLLTGVGAEVLSRNAQNGQLDRVTLGTSVESLSYNNFGEMIRGQTAYSGSTLFDETLTRNNGGMITKKVESILGITHTDDYGYDGVGRLKTVDRDGSTLASYSYDSNGNRITLVNSSGTVNSTFDSQDRITTSGTKTFTYSLAGDLNQIVESNGNLTTLFDYDVFSNLKSVTKPDGTLIEYTIDGMNRRVGKKINGSFVKQYLYQNQYQIIAEFDPSGNIVSRFIYGSKANIPDFMIKANVTYKIISDHLGSPKLIVNLSDGSIAQAIQYDEFGQVTHNSNPGFIPFGFAGCLYDDDTKLCRFGARDYDASIGRWLSKDPIFPRASLNAYDYGLNDPINHIDPTGLATTVVITYDLGFGSHAAVYTDANGGLLYDPGGSYQNSTRGSGGFFDGSQTNLAQFLAFERAGSGSVQMFTFDTTVAQETQIQDNIIAGIGGNTPGLCTMGVCSVLQGIGPFQNLQMNLLPGSLAGQLEKLQGQQSCGGK